jgi:NADH-quinone oxidoreductase subunit G
MGGQVAALNPMDYEQNFPLTEALVVAPSALPAALARIAIARVGQVEVPEELRQWAELIADSEEFARTAKMLSDVEGEVVVVLGQIAAQHREASALRAIASWLAQHTGIRLAFLPEANSAAAWIAGCVPHRQANGDGVQEPGLNVSQMLTARLSAYLLFGLEPTMDLAAAGNLVSALSDASFVLSFSTFRSAVPAQADVVFPLAPFTESAGTYVNCDGRAQSVEAAMDPRGMARPGWKILRVLGNYLALPGFDYITADDVRSRVNLSLPEVVCRLEEGCPLPAAASKSVPWSVESQRFERVVDVPIYDVDPIVRRASSLQRTRDHSLAAVHMNVEQLRALNVKAGDSVRVVANTEEVRLTIAPDDRVLDGCVYIPMGSVATAPLGGADYIELKLVR